MSGQGIQQWASCLNKKIYALLERRRWKLLPVLRGTTPVWLGKPIFVENSRKTHGVREKVPNVADSNGMDRTGADWKNKRLAALSFGVSM